MNKPYPSGAKRGCNMAYRLLGGESQEENSETITSVHPGEAIGYRSLDRGM